MNAADQSRLPEKLRVDFDIVGLNTLEGRPFRLKLGFTTAAGMSAEFRVESMGDAEAAIAEAVQCAFLAMKAIDRAQARDAMDQISARMNELLEGKS